MKTNFINIIKKISVISYSILILISYSSNTYAKIYIDITKPFLHKLPIVIPEFTQKSNNPPLLIGINGNRILSQALSHTGIFDILDSNIYPNIFSSDTKIDYSIWKNTTAEILITGIYYNIHEDNLSINLQLHDIIDNRIMLSRHYNTNIQNLSSIIHRFADEVMEFITGEKSIFSTQIAFVHAEFGKKEIWLINYDGSNPQQLTHHGDLSLYPSWAPDGTMIAYTSYLNRRPVIYIRNIKSNVSRIIYNKTGINLTPVFLPKTEQIAASLSYTGRTNIFIGTLSGNIEKNLTNGLGIDVSPTFSPDGNKMAFVSDRGGSPQIYILDMKNETINRLSFGHKYCAAPNWSPSGNRIAYQARINNQFQIVSIKNDGSDMQILTDNPYGAEDPSWAPDGKLLIYTSRISGRYQLYLITASGQFIHQLTDLPGENTNPSWSPRGVIYK